MKLTKQKCSNACINLSYWEGHASALSVQLHTGQAFPRQVCVVLSYWEGHASALSERLHTGRAFPRQVCVVLSYWEGHASALSERLHTGRVFPQQVSVVLSYWEGHASALSERLHTGRAFITPQPELCSGNKARRCRMVTSVPHVGDPGVTRPKVPDVLSLPRLRGSCAMIDRTYGYETSMCPSQ
jgi:hypothetical protein